MKAEAARLAKVLALALGSAWMVETRSPSRKAAGWAQRLLPRSARERELRASVPGSEMSLEKQPLAWCWLRALSATFD